MEDLRRKLASALEGDILVLGGSLPSVRDKGAVSPWSQLLGFQQRKTLLAGGHTDEYACVDPFAVAAATKRLAGLYECSPERPPADDPLMVVVSSPESSGLVRDVSAAAEAFLTADVEDEGGAVEPDPDPGEGDEVPDLPEWVEDWADVPDRTAALRAADEAAARYVPGDRLAVAFLDALPDLSELVGITPVKHELPGLEEARAHLHRFVYGALARLAVNGALDGRSEVRVVEPDGRLVRPLQHLAAEALGLDLYRAVPFFDELARELGDAARQTGADALAGAWGQLTLVAGVPTLLVLPSADDEEVEVAEDDGPYAPAELIGGLQGF